MVRTQEILKTVPEEGTAVFKLTFKDSNGDLVIPETLFWDLTDLSGAVVAYNQEVTSLASEKLVTISGSNLRILEDELSYGERLITFRATYSSGLPLNKQIKFRVQNLKLIGYPLSVSAVDAIFTDDYLEEVGVA